jgi:hypothetical protein
MLITHKLEKIITYPPIPVPFVTWRNLQSFSLRFRTPLSLSVSLRVWKFWKRGIQTQEESCPDSSLGILSRFSISPSIVCVFPLPVWETRYTHNKNAHKTLVLNCNQALSSYKTFGKLESS